MAAGYVCYLCGWHADLAAAFMRSQTRDAATTVGICPGCWDRLHYLPAVPSWPPTWLGWL